MEAFMVSFERQKDAKFCMYRENIPNFESTLSSITKSTNSIKILLEDISNVQKVITDPCEQSCSSCSPNVLNKFLGIEEKLVNNVEIPDSVPQKSTRPCLDDEKEGSSVVQPPESGNRHVQLISEQEFKSIPKYQLGRLTLDNLNEIVGKMDEFLTKKNAILGKTNKQITRQDREVLDNWRELEIKAKGRLPTTLFFIENDIRPLLTERLRLSFAKAIPCLRHIRRVREERCGPLTFYYA
ncbi:Protein CBR-SKA-1 [Caenorhabditis briggsae]|uniref:SKA complex subunit 1 n=1 Tax=Caenorhabditis briggsae TaxID=6238 RepID=SKA1_CAEBR|nr:Protein CBR-SKA-1 [Caenorhabditis briggsae]A8WS92.1 RecName: Full=Spindle and kinetochore-associated protein 1 homolog [Caenorhabditis briggsae]CAP23350.1 Protein CBR-SKA-1 [Caenorhabditis briggsae]